MGHQKSRKRLVSKRKYFELLGQKIGLFISGIAVLVFALYLLRTNETDFVLAVFTYAMLYVTYALLKKGMTMEPVEVITDQNVHLLPVKDTLVRSSDVSPSVEPSELLRAIQTDQQTPSEQLLRAGQREEYREKQE